jgi:hypothetical protein
MRERKPTAMITDDQHDYWIKEARDALRRLRDARLKLDALLAVISVEGVDADLAFQEDDEARDADDRECRPRREDGLNVCAVHGSLWHAGCLTMRVLNEVARHRAFQYQQYGANRETEDGTGRDVGWLEAVHDAHFGDTAPLTAFEIEGLFREEWDYPKDGTADEQASARARASWMRMMREEVAEAFAETADGNLASEVIQVAALGSQWVERLREREMGVGS